MKENLAALLKSPTAWLAVSMLLTVFFLTYRGAFRMVPVFNAPDILVGAGIAALIALALSWRRAG